MIPQYIKTNWANSSPICHKGYYSKFCESSAKEEAPLLLCHRLLWLNGSVSAQIKNKSQNKTSTFGRLQTEEEIKGILIIANGIL